MLVSRNALCICGSGKKYKRCCHDKQINNLSGNSERVPKEISENEYKIVSYEITTEPIEDDDINAMAFDDREKFIGLSKNIVYGEEVDFSSAISFLIDLKEKYPRLKRCYNLLGICYQELKKTDIFESLIKETYEKFPDYIFARTSYVNYHLTKGNLSMFDTVFEGKKDLSMLYPERKSFHVSEVEAFFYTCGLYFAMKNDVRTSERYYYVLKKIKPNSPGLWRLETEMLLALSKQKKKFWKW